MKHFLFTLIALLPSLAVAQTAQPEEESIIESTTISMTEFLEKGGIVMYPLIALSVIVVILIFFYLLTIHLMINKPNHF